MFQSPRQKILWQRIGCLVTLRRQGVAFAMAAALWALPHASQADGPPSPYDQNPSGAFFGAATTFGQSRASSASNPGFGWLMAGEAGYVGARQEWNRMEISAEAGFGQASFKNNDKLQVDLDIPFYGLVKFGYAYNLGSHTFGVIRVGAGPAMASYPAKAIVGSNSSESLTGFAGLIGYDIVLPAHPLEFVAGAQLRMMSFNGDKIESFQLNIPAIHLGARIRI